MEFILWIVFGGVVGWVGSLIMGTDGQQGIIINIVVGIVGAVLGGYIMSVFGGNGVTGINLYSFVVALVGAIALLAIVKLIRGSKL
jgi:uncharacterized membrane protein YeaQ/YmgE (transglycosylase-associated protein family)